MRIEKWYPRFWAVYDDDGELVCVTVYKKGAKEVVRRLGEGTRAIECQSRPEAAASQ
jgi:hypothetical protein